MNFRAPRPRVVRAFMDSLDGSFHSFFVNLIVMSLHLNSAKNKFSWRSFVLNAQPPTAAPSRVREEGRRINKYKIWRNFGGELLILPSCVYGFVTNKDKKNAKKNKKFMFGTAEKKVAPLKSSWSLKFYLRKMRDVHARDSQHPQRGSIRKRQQQQIQ